MKRILLLLFFLLTSTISMWAYHIPGGVITYEYLGSNQYLVTLSLYQQCGLTEETNANKIIEVTDSCSGNVQTFSLPNIVYEQEVSDICPASMDSSACALGSMPGFFLHQWQGVITLNTSSCAIWNFSFTLCCRNEAVNTVGVNVNDFHISSRLDVSKDPNNSSSQFTDLRVPTFCLNQQVSYSVGAYDPDGDELRFELVPARQSETTLVPYDVGYSGLDPIPGIHIDSLSGLITFTPTMTGIFQLAVLVKELDSNGDVKATLQHDMQVYILNCTNQQPILPTGGLTIVSGSGVASDSNVVDICAGGSTCFDIEFTDSNLGDNLTVSTNVQQVFPGATVSVTGTNPAIAHICLTPPANASQYYTMQFKIEDDACPSTGVNYYSVLINVVEETIASADTTICGTQEALLSVSGGSVFDWSVISGDPIVIGSNFSCDTCVNVIATPSVTTSYKVVSNLAGCPNIDTVTINVVPDFTYSIVTSNSLICNVDTIFYSLSSSVLGSTILIDSIPGISSSSGSNLYFHNSSFIGEINYPVLIQSPAGCAYSDTLFGTLRGIPAQVQAIQYNDTLICELEELELFTSMVAANDACQTIPINEIEENIEVQIGSQTVTNGTFSPTPFFGYYEDSKIQALYRASDLQAMGTPHYLSKLAFYVTSVNSNVPYNEFTIKVGCTEENNLTGGFVGGLSEVYYVYEYEPSAGWNVFNFSSGYVWDGHSNLVVQVCFNDTSWSQSDHIWLDNSSYPSCKFGYIDGSSGCDISFGTVSNQLPVIKFYGDVTSSPGYSYSWTPSAQFTYPDSNYVTTDPVVSQYYYLEVSDTSGLCPSTIDSVFITHSTGGEAYFSYSNTNPCLYDGNLFTDSITTSTGVFSVLPSFGIDPATGEIDTSTVVPNTDYWVYHTTSGIGRCDDNDSILVNFRDLDDASFSFLDYCEGTSELPVGIVTAGGNFGFTPIPSDGATINSTTGEITGGVAGNVYGVSYTTNGGACSSSLVQNLTIIPSDDPSFNFDDFCPVTSGFPSNIVTPGGTFSLTGGAGGVINAVSGELISTVGSGETYSVQYITNQTCPDTMVVDVTTFPIWSSEFEFDRDVYCINESNPVPVPDNIGGQYFSPTATVDASTGELNLAASGGGTFEIQYLLGVACTDTASYFVEIQSTPEIVPSVRNESCEDACDGGVVLDITGGTSPFVYNLVDEMSDTLVFSTDSLDQLCNGDYEVIVYSASSVNNDIRINSNGDFELGSGAGCDCPTGYICDNDAGQVFDGTHPAYHQDSAGCMTDGTNYTNSLGAYSGNGYLYFYAGGDKMTTPQYNFAGGENLSICVHYAGPQGTGGPGQSSSLAYFTVAIDSVQVSGQISVPTNTQWTEYCFDTIIPSGNHSFQLISGGAAMYSIWFDDFFVTHQSTETSLPCSNSEYFEVDYSLCDIIFYSGFTPNGDQINDTWNIEGLSPSDEISVQILNRWGDLVWSAEEYDNLNYVWDGTNSSGVELPEGVYYYVVDLRGEVYKGFIELSR